MSRTPCERASLDSHDRTTPRPRHIAEHRGRQVRTGRCGRQPGCIGPGRAGNRRPRRPRRPWRPVAGDLESRSTSPTTGDARAAGRGWGPRARTAATRRHRDGAGDRGRRPALRQRVGSIGLPARCMAPGQGSKQFRRHRRRDARGCGPAAWRRSRAEATARIRFDERARIRDADACGRSQRPQARPAARLHPDGRRPARPGPERPAAAGAWHQSGGRSCRPASIRAGPLSATASAAAGGPGATPVLGGTSSERE
jgi:hypothetical protein